MTKTLIPSTEGFTQEDFDVFHIEGLEQRMEAIQAQIRPKFLNIGQHLAAELSIHEGSEHYLHIAKHARRTVNPPKDTWLALCMNKRGYKAHPHFQVGLFEDHLFIWLAFIYELPNKKQIAQTFLNEQEQLFHLLPKDYVISQDHMQKNATTVESLDVQAFESILKRFRDVGKAELLIGRHLKPDSELVKDQDALIQVAKETYLQLLPIYRLAYTAIS